MEDDYKLDIELDILVGCDGSGKTTAYNNLKKEYDEVGNTIFCRFPTDDIRHLISQIPPEFKDEYPLTQHKLFEVDFHQFFQIITDINFLEHDDIEIDEPITVVMDRFFPCNMAYGLYNLGDHPWVLPTLDYLKNFINKDILSNTTLKIHILHISPNIEEWVKYNGESMNTSFLFTIEENYQNVYNYLRENYSSSDLEGRGIDSLKISKFYNNYDGNLEKELSKVVNFPKI